MTRIGASGRTRGSCRLQAELRASACEASELRRQNAAAWEQIGRVRAQLQRELASERVRVHELLQKALAAAARARATSDARSIRRQQHPHQHGRTETAHNPDDAQPWLPRGLAVQCTLVGAAARMVHIAWHSCTFAAARPPLRPCVLVVRKDWVKDRSDAHRCRRLVLCSWRG